MSVSETQRRNLKWLLWLYFWLLIFEGALRKWILPQLSAPLLIVRDPVVVLIYAQAVTCRIFPRNVLIGLTAALAVFCFFASYAGIGNLKITLFGLRTDFLHLPLIFLIPRIFDYEDVKNIGKWLLILSPPMAVLVFLQFRASPDARINAAAGGEVGGQLYAALGRIRPPGVFSFVTGMVSYLTLVAAYLAHHFVDRKIYTPLLIYASMAALGVSLAVSGSRSAVAGVAIVIIMVVLIGIKRGVASISYLKYPVLFYLLYVFLSHIPVFREGLMVQQERFESGGGIHEGLIDRFFDELVTAFDACWSTPALGFGLGVGTNAGASLLSGTRQFLLSEGEWRRVVQESGPALGLAYIALRFGILFSLIGSALKSFRFGNSLPLLLLSAIGLDLVTGQFSQPTELGFVVFASGLCLVPAGNEPAATPRPMQPDQPRKIRGRSPYAEALHGDKPEAAA